MTESRYGFGAPFIDVDEWRDEPRRHRYVHGGFEDTHTLFSFYFPPAEEYHGRFFQFLEGGAGGTETVLTNPMMGGTWMFDLAFDELGGYLLESNQGHYLSDVPELTRTGGAKTGRHPGIDQYGASAEAARYSKQLAEEMYGSAPHHGYVFGSSGGGTRSVACIENEPEIYDGACPAMLSSTGIWQQWPAVGQWWLHARHQAAEIVDATSPGGSGNPFEGLTNDQREALAALYRLGYPRGGEAFLGFSPTLMFKLNVDDPYYDSFWNEPGYLGHDNAQSLGNLVIDEKTQVGRVARMSEMGPQFSAFVTAGLTPDRNYAITLEQQPVDPTQLLGCRITILSGKAAGREVYVFGVEDSLITAFPGLTPELFDDVEPGDEVQVDNRRYIALSYLHRYMVDFANASVDDPVTGERTFSPEYAGLQGATVDHLPVYPQTRHVMANPDMGHSGRFEGKMIAVHGTADTLHWPTEVAAYHRLVRGHRGDLTDDSFRVYWIEHGPHGGAEMLGPMLTDDKDPGRWRSRFTGFEGVNAQALRDLVRWVEDDVSPPAGTAYHFTDSSGLVLPARAEARGGIQPVVTASANGGARADVKVGETVQFEGSGELPIGTGSIVWARWDFEGTGDESFENEVDGLSPGVTGQATHTYTEPGTYFAGFRVGAHREGKDGHGAAAENLARVRVVVTA